MKQEQFVKDYINTHTNKVGLMPPEEVIDELSRKMETEGISIAGLKKFFRPKNLNNMYYKWYLMGPRDWRISTTAAYAYEIITYSFIFYVERYTHVAGPFCQIDVVVLADHFQPVRPIQTKEVYIKSTDQMKDEIEDDKKKTIDLLGGEMKGIMDI